MTKIKQKICPLCKKPHSLYYKQYHPECLKVGDRERIRLKSKRARERNKEIIRARDKFRCLRYRPHDRRNRASHKLFDTAYIYLTTKQRRALLYDRLFKLCEYNRMTLKTAKRILAVGKRYENIASILAFRCEIKTHKRRLNYDEEYKKYREKYGRDYRPVKKLFGETRS